ncbi:transposable element Tcb2 transposase [Trichonephila clavipes]|nr:transposable element Tcb2 transposase [Trichonephila clavipes]
MTYSYTLAIWKQPLSHDATLKEVDMVRLDSNRYGARFNSTNIRERGGPVVLVWGGIMLIGRAELHIFVSGPLFVDSFCDEIILPYVRLVRGAIGPNFISVDDNAHPYRIFAV